MEREFVQPILEQSLVRGRYERNPTDTAHLAYELARPQDVGRLVIDFDGGLTPLRDVGNLSLLQRQAIGDAYQSGSVVNLARIHPEIVYPPVTNLHYRVAVGPHDQPVGHNFFVNAHGFVQANRPWAMQFDQILRDRTGSSIAQIAGSADFAAKDQLLMMLTNSPDAQLAASIAVHLVGRSIEGERFLVRQYGEDMERAKTRLLATTRDLASMTGIRSDMLERATGQLQRARFGSFDHLAGLVTSENTGSAGDYEVGTLLIEVKSRGSIANGRPLEGGDASQVMAHELAHAMSAQVESRCGLQVNDQGLQVNEGMTEFLALVSMNPKAKNRRSFRNSTAYAEAVEAIQALFQNFRKGRDSHFGVLFNAYHGDVRDNTQLEAALDEFYRRDSTTSFQGR